MRHKTLNCLCEESDPEPVEGEDDEAISSEVLSNILSRGGVVYHFEI